MNKGFFKEIPFFIGTNEMLREIQERFLLKEF